ncbi:MAG TPA: DUF2516 family protein [Mycobacteriales bacterium]|nr:DUF2516 family protein [Mycobacteriales bacterium]
MISGLLLFPLHGAFLIIALASLVVRVAALVDALLRPEGAYVAAGKQTKAFWLVVLFIGMIFTLIGLIAAIVYLVDVRPAIRGASGGGGSGRTSSSDGPYGPYRG